MTSTNKVRVLCRFGGNFIWDSNKVYYKGGMNRIVHVDRVINYLSFSSKMCGICKLTDVSSIKYKYPSLDLDSLVSIENDDDVSNMMEAFPQSKGPIHLFVFGAQNFSIPIPIPSHLTQNANTRNVQPSLRGLHRSNETFAPSSHNTNADNNDIPSASNDLHETHCLSMDRMMPILKEGQEFEDANAFDKALREYAIHSNFQYKQTGSGGGHYQAKCSKGDCSWRIHVCKVPNKPTFKIKSFKGNHTCNAVNESTMSNTTTHRQASRKCIAALDKDRLQKKLHRPPKDIINEVNREYEIKVSNDKAWRGNELTLKEMHYEQSVTTLMTICEEVQTTNLGSTPKLISIDEPFEDVVYPKGDPDAVLISKRDVEVLQPETFINDTIIDFYLKYLENKIHLEDKQRFHFFNSFFFRKLADLDKDPGSAKEGRAAFLRVHKWTRKVNIFEKDYIFIPVNFNLHWSLMVICHPGKLANFKDEEIEKAPKVPCILHMDSIKGSRKGLRNIIQSYLWEEWKERQRESSKDVSLKFSNLQFVPLELPQQENAFDCGLFLLHYVELFLEVAPVNFNPFKINFSNFLNVDWFLPSEASHKRSVIQKLIFELLNDHSLKIPPACSSQHGSKFQEISAQKEQAVEFLSEQCSPTKKRGLGDSFCSIVNGGIEIKPLPPSPRSVPCDKKSGIIFGDFLKQGDIGGSSLNAQCEPFHQVDSFQELRTLISPSELKTEDVRESRPLMKESSTEPAFKRPRIETPQPLTTFMVRKEKLGDRITTLQELVSPFGKTDTASVLFEAMEYIKFLHYQVLVLSSPYMKIGAPMQQPQQQQRQLQQNSDKSKDGEGPKLDLRNWGLCLVPSLGTFDTAVTNGTAADFWTPAFGGTFR